MKEFFLALLTLSLFDRRKQQETCHNDRRKITAKRAQKMLYDSIERLNKTLDERK